MQKRVHCNSVEKLLQFLHFEGKKACIFHFRRKHFGPRGELAVELHTYLHRCLCVRMHVRSI